MPWVPLPTVNPKLRDAEWVREGPCLPGVPAGETTTHCQWWRRPDPGWPYCGLRSPKQLGPQTLRPVPASLCLPAWGSRRGGKADGPPGTGTSDPSRPHPLQPSSHPLASGPTTSLQSTEQSSPGWAGNLLPKPPQSFLGPFFLRNKKSECEPHTHRVKAPPRAGGWGSAHMGTHHPALLLPPPVPKWRGVEEAGLPLEPHLCWAA